MPLPFFAKVCKKYQKPQHNVLLRIIATISCALPFALLYGEDGGSCITQWSMRKDFVRLFMPASRFYFAGKPVNE